MTLPDNFSQWEAHERQQEAMRDKLPTCERCGNAIQQEWAVCIDGAWYCDDCIEYFQKEVIPCE